MDYIRRELERKFLAMNQVFKAVMVTGARQDYSGLPVLKARNF